MTSLLTLELGQLRGQLQLWRRKLDRQVGEAQAAAVRGRQLVGEVAQLNATKLELVKAAEVLTSIGETRQQSAQHQIEALVTRGLQVIFEDDMSFHVAQSVKANRPQVDFMIRSKVNGSEVETSVLDARGGGVASVVGFLLRLVVILLGKEPNSLMVLDETFGMVSKDYEPRVAEFLRELVDKTGIQVLMVTHSDAFDDVADRRYRFSLSDGCTKVAEL